MKLFLIIYWWQQERVIVSKLTKGNIFKIWV